MNHRILQVNAFYAKVGGAEVYMHRLVEALRAQGMTVGVFGGSPEEELDGPEVRVHRRPDFEASLLIRDPELADAFRGFCERFRPDLIHVHNIGSLAAEFAGVVASIGVPVVQTVHEWGQLCPNAWCVLPDGTVCGGGPGTKCLENGCESNYPFDGRVLVAAILRYNLIPKTFQRFLCPSQALADDLARHGYPNTSALPLWAEGEPDGADSAGLERDPNLILFLGRLVPEKGVEFLVRAMPNVLRSKPEARLSVVGGGSEEERLRALAAELSLGDRVAFHGRVPHEQVQNYFRTAWVNVLPSIWCENSPVTCYESYLSGLPMVASNIAGLPAMVVEGETGLLARPRDPEHLADRLIEILDDRPLHERLTRGCLDALKRYSREKHVAGILETYGELLSGKDSLPVPDRPRGPEHSVLAEDVIGILDRTVREYSRIEKWAIDMKKHIDWIESEEPPSTLSRLARKLGKLKD